MKMIDAHNHLHDARLRPHLPVILPAMKLARAVVNGTSEKDWPQVAAFAAEHSWVLPSFGLHPWLVGERSPHWLARLRAQLDAHPTAGVGEIGLDAWIEGHNLADQSSVFAAQLALAAERELPVTIHCLRAWGALGEIVRTHPLPARGFLIHAYGGSMEMMREFVNRGALFSFSPFFLQDRKAAQREVFAAIPEDRLLVETDAPDLRPPDEFNPHPLHDENGAPLNHPANLEVAYAALAKIRKISVETLVGIVGHNFRRWFESRGE